MLVLAHIVLLVKDAHSAPPLVDFHSAVFRLELKTENRLPLALPIVEAEKLSIYQSFTSREMTRASHHENAMTSAASRHDQRVGASY